MRKNTEELSNIARNIASHMCYARPSEEGQILTTPLLYPGGDLVTALIEKTAEGFKVSDAGAACQEADLIDEQTDYARYAEAACAHYGVQFADGVIFAETASADDLLPLAMSVANASKMALEKFAEAVANKRPREKNGQFARFPASFSDEEKSDHFPPEKVRRVG